MADEGARPAELLLEACRRNNITLLQQVFDIVIGQNRRGNGAESLADFLNSTADPVGRGCLHLAAESGSYEVLDTLLDQEGVEVDLQDRLDGDTPLHKANKYVNSVNIAERDGAGTIVELLLEAGASPMPRNKARQRPSDVVDPRNTTLRALLKNAEGSAMIMAESVQSPPEMTSNDEPSDSD